MTTFGLVHGGGFGAWCWEWLIPAVEARGHRAATVDLPPEYQAAGAAQCAAVVACAFASSDDLALVGHSLAGLIIPLVAAERPVRR
jgi:pimeloyl-ACP methyl ester carboxylesterase